MYRTGRELNLWIEYDPLGISGNGDLGQHFHLPNKREIVIEAKLSD